MLPSYVDQVKACSERIALATEVLRRSKSYGTNGFLKKSTTTKDLSNLECSDKQYVLLTTNKADTKELESQ